MFSRKNKIVPYKEEPEYEERELAKVEGRKIKPDLVAKVVVNDIFFVLGNFYYDYIESNDEQKVDKLNESLDKVTKEIMADKKKMKKDDLPVEGEYDSTRKKQFDKTMVDIGRKLITQFMLMEYGPHGAKRLIQNHKETLFFLMNDEIISKMKSLKEKYFKYLGEYLDDNKEEISKKVSDILRKPAFEKNEDFERVYADEEQDGGKKKKTKKRVKK